MTVAESARNPTAAATMTRVPGSTARRVNRPAESVGDGEQGSTNADQRARNALSGRGARMWPATTPPSLWAKTGWARSNSASPARRARTSALLLLEPCAANTACRGGEVSAECVAALGECAGRLPERSGLGELLPLVVYVPWSTSWLPGRADRHVVGRRREHQCPGGDRAASGPDCRPVETTATCSCPRDRYSDRWSSSSEQARSAVAASAAIQGTTKHVGISGGSTPENYID